MPASMEEFADMAVSLCERVDLGPAQLFRLVGVGLSNFQMEPERDVPLFASEEREMELAAPTSA
jgi:DNA polymerase IV